MNWDRLFTSPPPSTGWVFDSEMVAVAHRSKTEEIHCSAEDLPAGGLDVGPVGLQAVNDRALGPVLARLKGAAGGTDSAAVIVPTSWLRSFLVDVDRVPRRETELLDVVRWRLKKLLPVAPTELRLAVVRLSEIEGQRRILVMTGLERAMAGLENAFAEIGVEVGLITTRLFALVPRLAGVNTPILVIQHEERFLSFLLLLGGVPRLLRTKPLSSTNGGSEAVLREATLTVGFIRDSIGLADTIEVRVSCEQPQMDAVIREWMSEQPGLAATAEEIGPACGPTTVVNRIGAARLGPALAVVSGLLR